ncbi:MAG: isoprenyl transferase [Phycisphaerae bacterium]|nr:MAG: isoprenyl transferase [Phycisphaerae bacterium]
MTVANTVPTQADLDAPGQAALERIRARNPGADPRGLLPDVNPARLPRHVAIIMDGNGRWATARGFPREFGHRNGAATVRAVVRHAGRLGVEAITLYSFSLENWKRPAAEVEALMQLCRVYLEGEERELVSEGIRFRVIGRRDGLPAPVVEAIERVERATAANTRATLCLAINYGSRDEIVGAARRLAGEVAAGALTPAQITESVLAERLDTAGLPDPDLLIRTAGEMRLSNFLLWQVSYAEIVVTPTLWPDFRAADLDAAIREYASRTRRYGAVDEASHA